MGESWQRQQNPENGKNNNHEHVKYLNVRAVLVEGTYVIGVAGLKVMCSSGDDGGRPVGGWFFGGGVSWRMMLCSRLRRSNARSELSTPTDMKMTVEFGNHATSYTSRSCALYCVTIDVSRFQTVHVVSIEDVITSLEVFSFHEKLVSGAPPRWPIAAEILAC